MEWNVFYYDINCQKMSTFNIFDHGRFREDVSKDVQECSTKEEFEGRLKTDLIYYFWCKSEWEIIISPWIGDKDAGVKIDVYTQVVNNWNAFLSYVWQSKN